MISPSLSLSQNLDSSPNPSPSLTLSLSLSPSPILNPISSPSSNPSLHLSLNGVLGGRGPGAAPHACGQNAAQHPHRNCRGPPILDLVTLVLALTLTAVSPPQPLQYTPSPLIRAQPSSLCGRPSFSRSLCFFRLPLLLT